MDNNDTKKNKKVRNKENSEKTETKTKIEFPSFYDYFTDYKIIIPISSSIREKQILKLATNGRFENIKIKENEIISILKSTFQLAKSNFNPSYTNLNK